jgi:hypothetical protein
MESDWCGCGWQHGLLFKAGGNVARMSSIEKFSVIDCSDLSHIFHEH